MNLTCQIVLVQEDDKWWAYIPDLPGVFGLGNSEEEAKQDITKALELYLDDINEWQIAEIKKAVEAADKPDAKWIDHDEIKTWLKTWSPKKERKPPQCG